MFDLWHRLEGVGRPPGRLAVANEVLPFAEHFTEYAWRLFDPRLPGSPHQETCIAPDMPECDIEQKTYEASGLVEEGSGPIPDSMPDEVGSVHVLAFPEEGRVTFTAKTLAKVTTTERWIHGGVDTRTQALDWELRCYESGDWWTSPHHPHRNMPTGGLSASSSRIEGHWTDASRTTAELRCEEQWIPEGATRGLASLTAGGTLEVADP